MRIFEKEEAIALLNCCKTEEEKDALFSEYVEKGVFRGAAKLVRKPARKGRTFIVNKDGSTTERILD